MRHAPTLTFLCGLLFLAACSPSPAPEPEEQPVPRFTDDLPGIVERGTLRVIVESDDDHHLPRNDDPSARERSLAETFAARHGLKVSFVPRDTFATLLDALQSGEGDLVAANMTVTAERQALVDFSSSLAQSNEVLVGRAGEPLPEAPEELRGTLGVPAGTSFEATAWQVASLNPALSVKVWKGSLTFEDALDSVVGGQVDFTIKDSNRIATVLEYRKDIQTGPAMSTERPMAWAVRKSNPELRAALNDFLHVERLLGVTQDAYTDDLPEIKQRRKIRMITRNNAANYFLWRGEILGFEYELARRFAKEQDLRLEVIVAPTNDDLIPMLEAGEGDFIASFMTRTDERLAAGLQFSRPYHFASEVIVGRASEAPMDSPMDLAGRSIAVRRSSSYWAHLDSLRSQLGVEFELVEAPSTMETEDIIAAVGDGEYDLTLADSHLLELEMTVRDDLRGLLVLGDPIAHGWVVRPGNSELLQEIDSFIGRYYRGLFYNTVYEKYFLRPERLESGWEQEEGRLSPYDDLVRELAAAHDYDWRLIVAQIFQESHFDPKARSWVGAMGLMQVMPRTARELGVTDLYDPRTCIQAGLDYLDWVWERFPDYLDPAEHWWFTLAAYNAGHGHVRDARRLARKLGLDANQWFGNVEIAMLKLSESRYANESRHGYVRGREPVTYVRNIREHYRAYVGLLEGAGTN